MCCALGAIRRVKGGPCHRDATILHSCVPFNVSQTVCHRAHNKWCHTTWSKYCYTIEFAVWCDKNGRTIQCLSRASLYKSYHIMSLWENWHIADPKVHLSTWTLCSKKPHSGLISTTQHTTRHNTTQHTTTHHTTPHHTTPHHTTPHHNIHNTTQPEISVFLCCNGVERRGGVIFRLCVGPVLTQHNRGRGGIFHLRVGRLC